MCHLYSLSILLFAVCSGSGDDSDAKGEGSGGGDVEDSDVEGGGDGSDAKGEGSVGGDAEDSDVEGDGGGGGDSGCGDSGCGDAGGGGDGCNSEPGAPGAPHPILKTCPWCGDVSIHLDPVFCDPERKIDNELREAENFFDDIDNHKPFCEDDDFYFNDIFCVCDMIENVERYYGGDIPEKHKDRFYYIKFRALKEEIKKMEQSITEQDKDLKQTEQRGESTKGYAKELAIQIKCTEEAKERLAIYLTKKPEE